MKWSSTILLLTLVFSYFGAEASEPLIIQKQGAFSAGGSVIKASKDFDPYHPESDAMTLHGDHANVIYQIPVDPKANALVFLHGHGQSMRTWQTTPDGREGFQSVFLRKGYPVYLIDQPRRGDAGRATVDGKIEAKPDEQFWFGQFRLGMWPNFYKNSAFPSKENLESYWRQMTPNTAPYDAKIVSDAVNKVFEKSGDAILVTHSQGCGAGWLVGLQGDKHLKGIIAFEAGSSFVFPEGEVPAEVKNNGLFGPLKAQGVPKEEFLKLTHLPILIIYGDNIPSQETGNPYQDYWRAAVEMGKKFAECINKYGGNATVIQLPSIGIHGNTHFPFSDKNSNEVAEVVQKWIQNSVENNKKLEK